MILVLASAVDEYATALVGVWPVGQAKLLNPSNLSYPGWVSHLPENGDDTCVVESAVFSATSLTGVVSRLSWISPAELVYVAEADRSYISAEMNAFLTFWLTSLDCPVVNRATPTSLSGPGLRQEHWMQAGAQLGLKTRQIRRSSSASPPTAGGDLPQQFRKVVTLGQSSRGSADQREEMRLVELTAAHGACALEFIFGEDDTLLHVGEIPDFLGQGMGQGLFEYFCGDVSARDTTK